MDRSEFIKSFENCSIEPALFDHLHHVFMSWHYLSLHNFEEAEQKIFSGLTNLTKHIAVYDTKYHTTVTHAFIQLINKSIVEKPNLSWEEFKRENVSLFSSPKELLKNYYSFDVFNSEEARTNKIQPDLKPFKN